MSPHQTLSRIPLRVGSELRIRNDGEISVKHPGGKNAPSQNAAAALLDYRFDPQTGEHVLRLLEPARAARGGEDSSKCAA